MKIDYKNYPILESIHKRKLSMVSGYPEDISSLNLLIPSIKTNWHKHVANFQNITVITKPFLVACQQSVKMLGQLFREIANKEPIKLSGTFIVGDFVMMIDYEQVVNIGAGSMYIFQPSGELIGVLLADDGEKEKRQWTSGLLPVPTPEMISQSIIMLFSILLLKKYATVETKILKPHQRPREISCLYRNNTKLDILFLDCKWFTNLVKSEGFDVRGHFRLQPKKKEGKWTKELIWINSFHKDGYTSPARKLSYIEES